jgi:hypothetical protein
MNLLLTLFYFNLSLNANLAFNNHSLSDLTHHLDYLKAVAETSGYATNFIKEKGLEWGFSLAKPIAKDVNWALRFSYWSYDVDAKFSSAQESIVQKYSINYYNLPISFLVYLKYGFYLKTGFPLSFAYFRFETLKPAQPQQEFTFWGIGSELGIGFRLPIKFINLGIEGHYTYLPLIPRREQELWFFNPDKYLYISSTPVQNSREAKLDFSGLGFLVFLGVSF